VCVKAVRQVHGLSLLVKEGHGASSAGLLKLLDDLSFTKGNIAGERAPALLISVHRATQAVQFPPVANEVFRRDGLCAMQRGADFYVSDGSSLLCVDERGGRSEAFLAPAFSQRPRLLQQRFWAFGILKLLRGRGLYGLHAAGVATRTGLNLLMVGPSGSGKSTLTLGLVRDGCCYLSDDAVLLRAREQVVEVLTFRKPFSFNVDGANHCADLNAGPPRPSSSGMLKRRVDVQAGYPGQHLSGFVPNAIVFPRVAPATRSALRPMTRAAALGRLLEQSGVELFDRATMAAHLALLQRLVHQAETYELDAGSDLLQRPATLLDLVGQAQRNPPWHGSSSN
jgi:hypothetical protein